MFRRGPIGVVFITVVLVAGCGGDDAATEPTTESGDDAEPTVEILNPADGDEVGLPLTLEVDVSTEIGPPESGLHHVHVFFDGELDNFEVVDSETWEIAADSEVLSGVEPGEHVLNVAVHDATHAPAGGEDEVTVTIADAGDAPADDDEQPRGY